MDVGEYGFQATMEIVGNTLLWSALSTGLVMIPGVMLAYALARYSFPGKKVISTLVSLPLVLPPTAVGFLLLRLFAVDGPLGGNLGILLTWKAVVIACAVMSFPLIVRTARVCFEAVDPGLEWMSRSLGAGRIKTFLTITLPLAGRGLIASAILGFTRAMGEFGATVMIAGNIPGHTQTLSSAIFSAQQSGNDSRAHLLLIIALSVGFLAVFLTELLTAKNAKPVKGESI